MTLPVGTRASECYQRVEAHDNERLLPRIPDEVTLDLIAPKLSWGDCQRLASVSRRWRHGIRSRQVHDARIRRHSTETLVFLTYKPSEFCKEICLYSVRENRCYKLPQFPYLDGRIPPTSQCIALGSKIYVVGGEFLPVAPGRVPGSSGVYVLYIAGGRQWERCARMIEPRVDFGCGVFSSKIFVVGGLGNRRVLCGSEVYDPEEDTWSPIKAMTSLRFDHQVTTVGLDLIVHGGKVVERTSYAWTDWIGYHSSKGEWAFKMQDSGSCVYGLAGSGLLAFQSVCAEAEMADFLEIYNVLNDEGNLVAIPRHETDLSFMADGKLYSMTGNDIHVHDSESNSWTRLHSHSFSARGLVDSKVIVGKTALAVDDRLLAIVAGSDQYGEIKVCKACLLQGTGFGSANEEIKWARSPFTIYFEAEDIKFTNYSMQGIEL